MRRNEPKVWWCGIDHRYCYFLQLSKRQVIAQGVPALGDLTPLFQYLNNRDVFVNQIIQLAEEKHREKSENWWFENHESNLRKIPVSMFNLLSLASGDLVVALEGKSVKGICQLTQDALSSYRYQAGYNYAHTVGFPIDWVKWDSHLMGHEPIPPGQSVYGIRSLNKERDYVISSWNQYISKK